MSQVHPLARTTPRTRTEIRASLASAAVLAERYNVTIATVRKWKARDDAQDRSHRPHTLATTLTPAQELLAVEVRRTLLLPLDDLLSITREFINPSVSRSGLDRCLRRHGVSVLKTLEPEVEGQPKPAKTFKDYEPGFLHVDIKYLPQMPDESSRRYLFVAIDRATRWVYMRTYADQSERSASDFLRRLKQAAPMKIGNVLTDNGSQFTDRFTSKARLPTGKHIFDRTCASLGIEHRLCPPRHPQTNGMVERFNARIADLVKQTRFTCAAELDTTLQHYLSTYNHLIPQRSLDHQTPIQALQTWHREKPDLFVRRVYKQAGLDTYTSPTLLADTGDADGRNLLHALGIEPKVKAYVPKSIQAGEVLVRCEQLVPSFTKDVEIFCRGLFNKRNEELYNGGTLFSSLPNNSWLPRLYEAASVLLNYQKKSLEDFVGPEEAKAAGVMLQAVADEAAKSVQKQINAFAEVWKTKKPEGQEEFRKAANRHAQPWEGHVVLCPSCVCHGLLTGEDIKQQPPSLEGDELVVRTSVLPTAFECTACGLKISGHSQLHVAGLGGQFTNTATFDPVEYYAVEGEYPGPEYNNE